MFTLLELSAEQATQQKADIPKEPVRRVQVVSTSAVDSQRKWFGSPFNSGWPIWWPAAGLLAMSFIFRWTSLDLEISKLFFDRASTQWSWFFSPTCTFFYRSGTYPAFCLVIVGVLLLLAGLVIPEKTDWRKAGVFLVLVICIGPGLIVNYAFKQHWGRPRPHQLAEFGGAHAFTPLGSPGHLATHNSSFPSGHAAVAFYLIAPAFLVHGRRPRLANGLLAMGLAFGTCMSVTRVVQGGHFASDVMWSAGIVYLTCVAMARWILTPRIPHRLLNQAAFMRS